MENKEMMIALEAPEKPMKRYYKTAEEWYYEDAEEYEDDWGTPWDEDDLVIAEVED